MLVGRPCIKMSWNRLVKAASSGPAHSGEETLDTRQPRNTPTACSTLSAVLKVRHTPAV